jgi:hypothetical protein
VYVICAGENSIIKAENREQKSARKRGYINVSNLRIQGMKVMKKRKSQNRKWVKGRR